MEETMTMGFVMAVLGMGSAGVMKLRDAGLLSARFVVKDGSCFKKDHWEFNPHEVKRVAEVAHRLKGQGVRPTANCLIGYYKGCSTGKG